MLALKAVKASARKIVVLMIIEDLFAKNVAGYRL
jgi:hypothetical protein